MRDHLAHHVRKQFTQSMLTQSVLFVALAVGALVACGDDESDGEPAIAAELAPSQVSASTVPDPESPRPCDVEDLDFSFSADSSVIRVRNNGSVRCEVDVFESPLADPLMEPDVWLDPMMEAEILVERTADTCAEPEDVTTVELNVNGESVDVPVAVADTCGVSLTAIYAVDELE